MSVILFPIHTFVPFCAVPPSPFGSLTPWHILREPGHPVQLPPGLGELPAAGGVSVCGLALQELAQRPADAVGRPRPPPLRAAATRAA